MVFITYKYNLLISKHIIMNPLEKFYRQPKIYIQLPSKGAYYPEGVLDGDALNVPIYAMTGMDELIMKTPDALFNGEATVRLIESCCPYIKNAKFIPSLDTDTLLAAIRIATFGDSITITHKCEKCKEDNSYDISAQNIIDHYSKLPYDNKLELPQMTIYFRPLTYDQITLFNIENFKLQKSLVQLAVIEDTEKRQNVLDEIYGNLGLLQASIFIASIESIQLEETIVTDSAQIAEWISNCDREYYTKIKEHLEKIKTVWSMPKSKVKCTNCDHEELVDVSLDQSHFFV